VVKRQRKENRLKKLLVENKRKVRGGKKALELLVLRVNGNWPRTGRTAPPGLKAEGAGGRKQACGGKAIA